VDVGLNVVNTLLVYRGFYCAVAKVDQISGLTVFKCSKMDMSLEICKLFDSDFVY